jgi:vacuolar-type H+-ATPase subunit D/Vma8
MAKSAEIADRETDIEVAGLREEVRALAESLKELRARMEQQSKTLTELSERVAGGVAAAQPQPVASRTQPPEEEVSADTLLIMAAAVTAFLGKKVRIRSAKMLQSPYEIVNPWAQVGRVTLQASHRLQRTG